MERTRLLFYNEINYQKWESKKISNVSGIDLNIQEFTRFLEKINPDFESSYLLKPCLSIEDANYRLDIMEEILGDETIYNGFVSLSQLLKDIMNEMRIFNNETAIIQKMYRYIILLSSYYQILLSICNIIKSSKSSGLQNLYKYSFCIINENKNLFDDALNIQLKMKEILKDNLLSIDDINKAFEIRKKDVLVSDTELLKNMIQDVFDLDINNYFSIVDPAPLSNMEEKILDEIRKKNQEIFINIEKLYNNSIDLFSEIKFLATLYEEITFYITYIKFLGIVKKEGLNICKPKFTDFYKASNAISFPLVSLFIKNNRNIKEIVGNDIELQKEMMFILSGPNQGGKSIYLKTVGQTAYLGKCGVYVGCNSCDVPFYDEIYTHFIKQEIIGKGKLIEEVERIEDIIKRINGNSLVLLNESFTSTRRKDGVKIALYYIDEILKKKASIGFVTHYYEIANLYHDKSKLTSLTAGVDENGKRSYKVSINNGVSSAYAKDIASKCEMTYEKIMNMIQGDINEKG